jgi:hypothetical protein
MFKVTNPPYFHIVKKAIVESKNYIYLQVFRSNDEK